MPSAKKHTPKQKTTTAHLPYQVPERMYRAISRMMGMLAVVWVSVASFTFMNSEDVSANVLDLGPMEAELARDLNHEFRVVNGDHEFRAVFPGSEGVEMGMFALEAYDEPLVFSALTPCMNYVRNNEGVSGLTLFVGEEAYGGEVNVGAGESLLVTIKGNLAAETMVGTRFEVGICGGEAHGVEGGKVGVVDRIYSETLSVVGTNPKYFKKEKKKE